MFRGGLAGSFHEDPPPGTGEARIEQDVPHDDGHGGGHADPVAPVLIGIVIIFIAAKFGGELFEKYGPLRGEGNFATEEHDDFVLAVVGAYLDNGNFESVPEVRVRAGCPDRKKWRKVETVYRYGFYEKVSRTRNPVNTALVYTAHEEHGDLEDPEEHIRGDFAYIQDCLRRRLLNAEIEVEGDLMVVRKRVIDPSAPQVQKTLFELCS
jgi:hypothetical protein